MKHLLIIPLFVFLSCNSQDKKTKTDDKAQQIVKDYLDKNLKDPSSYQPIMFYPLVDNETLPPDNSPVTINLYMAQLEDYDATYYEDLCRDRRQSGWYAKRKIFYADSLEKEVKKFKPIKIGYLIYHSYRAKNSFGGLDIYHTAFYFDLNMNIIKTRDDAF